eukprot:1291072-Prymnesium_polylepis.1
MDRPVSIKRRYLSSEECRAADGPLSVGPLRVGQLYARIKYDDGSELNGWIGPGPANGTLEG